MDDDALKKLIGKMMPLLDEKNRRLFLGILADCLGRGSITKLNQITKISRVTISQGQKESLELKIDPEARSSITDTSGIRAPGGGRKKLEEKYPNLKEELLKLLDGNTIGNPENPLCWTTKSVRNLANELNKAEINIHYTSVGSILEDMGFSLQQNRKYVESGTQSVDRDEQFKFINAKSKEFIGKQKPVISVDTKKKELIGNYKNNGAEYGPKGNPVKVNDHDFGTERAAPYGVYDVAKNEGFVNIGLSADTGTFASNSIKMWWDSMGRERYPDANEILITADGGGSNGRRNRLWKIGLQDFANESGLTVHVCHFPPGTSKWNKIEHRMFAFISKNWRGKPLETIEVIVNLISSTTTSPEGSSGLKVTCVVDPNDYPTGIKISDEELNKVNLSQEEWHGEWNYIITPNSDTKCKG